MPEQTAMLYGSHFLFDIRVQELSKGEHGFPDKFQIMTKLRIRYPLLLSSAQENGQNHFYSAGLS